MTEDTSRTSGVADVAPEVVVLNGGRVCLRCHTVQPPGYDPAQWPALVLDKSPCPRCGQPTRRFLSVVTLVLEPDNEA